MKLKKRNQNTIGISVKNRKLDFPYYLLKKSEKIFPNRIKHENQEIRCDFDVGKIKDKIEEGKNSLQVERSWEIKKRGEFKLPFKIFSPYSLENWIIPCVNYNGNPKGEGKFPKPALDEGWSFREDRIGIPSCSIIKDDNGPIAFFTSPAKTEDEISSILTKSEDSGVSLVNLTPFSEKPRRHTNKWYLGDLPSAREEFFHVSTDFEFSRKFYILWEDDPESSYHSLLNRIWKKLSPNFETHKDWSKNAELRINHIIRNLYAEQKEAAGFLSSIHWSMVPINNTFSGGFVGKNPEIALSLYKAYLDSGEEKLKEISTKVLDFFTNAQLSNGLLLSEYQLAKKKWTGLHFLGKTDCSTRMMGEMTYNFIRAHRTAIEEDSNPKWLEIGKNFCEFMVQNQPENGNFGKWYTPKGKLSDSSGANGAYVIWPLVELYKKEGSNDYLDSAVQCAEFLIENFVEKDLYWGDALDSNCIDKEGGHSILRALLLLHDVTGDDYFLEFAEKVGNYVLTWMYFYDAPFSEGSPLGKRDFRTVGGTSVSTAHHHLDPYGAAIAYDWLKLWRKTGNEVWKEYAIAALDFVHQLVATKEDPLNLPPYFEGWQPEQVNQTDWDYVSNTIWGRGTFKSITAWVPALVLGAFFDIREEFPKVMNFEVSEVKTDEPRELKLSKIFRDIGIKLNFLV